MVYAGIHLLKLNRCAIGYVTRGTKYIYYGDTARSVEFWQWYMEELRKLDPEIYCVGECWSGETEILDYYSAMNCFNFAMSQAEGVVASAAKGFSISSYTNYISYFQDQVQGKNPDSMMISFLSNHDMDRIGGAFITENNTRMAANLYLLSPGSPVMYYGEELGMRGSRGGEMTDANYYLETVMTSLLANGATSGIADAVISNVTLGEKEVPCLHIVFEFGGSKIYQKLIVSQTGTWMSTVTVASLSEDELSELVGKASFK